MSKPGIKLNPIQETAIPTIPKNKIPSQIILYQTSEYSHCHLRGYKYLKKMNLCDLERPLSELTFNYENFELKAEDEGSNSWSILLEEPKSPEPEKVCDQYRNGQDVHIIENKYSEDFSNETQSPLNDPGYGPRLPDDFWDYESNSEAEVEYLNENLGNFLDAVDKKIAESFEMLRPLYPRRYLKYAGELITESSEIISIREVYEFVKDIRTFRTFSYRNESRDRKEIFFISQMILRAKDLRTLELEILGNNSTKNEYFNILKKAMRKFNPLK